MKLAISIVAAAILLGIQAQDKSAPAAKPDVAAPARKYKDLNPEAFDKIRRSETNVVVLDVRTKAEYDKAHIPGSVLIDFNSADFDKEIARLDKNKTYLVHC